MFGISDLDAVCPKLCVFMLEWSGSDRDGTFTITVVCLQKKKMADFWMRGSHLVSLNLSGPGPITTC